MTVTFSPAPKPRPKVKPPKSMRKKNAARQKDEFARCYHSRARQKWVSIQPCAACHIETALCDNAHVLGNDGAGRKGSFREIAPLCRAHLDRDGNQISEGCHAWSHRAPSEFAARFPDFNPRKAARLTEKRWQTFLRSGTSVEEQH